MYRIVQDREGLKASMIYKGKDFGSGLSISPKITKLIK